MIKIYTDGACSGNPGPGGWGAVILENVKNTNLGVLNTYKISGGEGHTTNNRMELTAVLEALRFVDENMDHDKQRIEIHSDSKYVVTAVKEGTMKKWMRSGWKKSNREPVKNQDLWSQIEQSLRAFRKVSFIWVKGHNGDKFNEMADKLARTEVDVRRMSNA